MSGPVAEVVVEQAERAARLLRLPPSRVYDRDDARQDAAVAILTALPRHDAGRAKLSTFLGHRARGGALDGMRSFLGERDAGRRPRVGTPDRRDPIEAADEVTGGGDPSEAAAARDLLDFALDERRSPLQPAQRAAVRDVLARGLSHAEAAARRGYTVNSSHKNLSTGLSRLREHFGVAR